MKSSKRSRQVKTAKVLTVFLLAMINVAAVASLRVLPVVAEFGLQSIFYFTLGALVFFLPAAFVSAEMATMWPGKLGGVYVWVKEALGDRWGFLCIWLQWIQSVTLYPIALSFTGASLAYVFEPKLAQNKWYLAAIILIVYWGATFVTFTGMKSSSLISTIGAAIGTIIPVAILIGLGVLWLVTKRPTQITYSFSGLFPDMTKLSSLVFATGVLLSFAGIEMSASHIREVKNPKRDYPRAILLSTVIILFIFVLGTLAVAEVVPKSHLSLVAGTMEAFTNFLDVYNLKFIIPLLGFIIALGGLGQVATWIAGPSKGLLGTAGDGEIPPFFDRVNKQGMPVNLLLMQGFIVTVLAFVFVLMPAVSSSFWILTALTAELYLIMYVLMFVSAIVLRYKRSDMPRAYKVPGGNLGMWAVAGIGALSSTVVFFISFLPPPQLKTGSVVTYDLFLGFGVLILGGAALLIHYLKKPEWVEKQVEHRKAA